jgi:hypothetical protein
LRRRNQSEMNKAKQEDKFCAHKSDFLQASLVRHLRFFQNR